MTIICYMVGYFSFAHVKKLLRLSGESPYKTKIGSLDAFGEAGSYFMPLPCPRAANPGDERLGKLKKSSPCPAGIVKGKIWKMASNRDPEDNHGGYKGQGQRKTNKLGEDE